VQAFALQILRLVDVIACFGVNFSYDSAPVFYFSAFSIRFGFVNIGVVARFTGDYGTYDKALPSNVVLLL